MLVGIDIGTQSLKAVVTGPDLEVRGWGAAHYPVEHPAPGQAEQQPALWERALAPAIGQALAAAGIAASEVTAIGLSGQLDGCLAVDAAGEPLGPCLIWIDRRAEEIVRPLPAERLRAATGLVPDAGHLAAKAAWLKRHSPQRRVIAGFHQPVSYLLSRLTGASLCDHGLASTSMVYALRDRRYDSGLLELFELTERELPAPAEASASAGPLSARGAALSGLPAGIPVAVGTGDDFANLLGAGVTDGARFACAIGTGEVVGALHDAPVIDEAALVETHCYPTSHYFLENPGWLSGGALRWLVETVRLRDYAELDALAAAVPPAAEGLLFLPALNGAMAPEWVASARGALYGLTPAHGSGHIARALMEGCAFAMFDVLQRLDALGVKATRIRLLGGGARSRLWAQIRADLSGLPVEIPEVVDCAPLGAAALAAVTSGASGSLEETGSRLARTMALIEPDPRMQARYRAAYADYRRFFDALRPMFAMPARPTSRSH